VTMKLLYSLIRFIWFSLLYSDRSSTAGHDADVRENYSPIDVRGKGESCVPTATVNNQLILF
jgi:hypothetical protein